MQETCEELCEEFIGLQQTLEGQPAAESRKRKQTEDLDGFITKRFSEAQSERNNTIQSWDDRTRLAVSAAKNKGQNYSQQSVLNQIDQVLSTSYELTSAKSALALVVGVFHCVHIRTSYSYSCTPYTVE